MAGPEKPKTGTEEVQSNPPAAPETPADTEKQKTEGAVRVDASKAGAPDAAAAEAVLNQNLGQVQKAPEWPKGLDADKKSWGAVRPLLDKKNSGQPMSAEEQKILDWADPAPTPAEEAAALKKTQDLLKETWSKSDPAVGADSIPVAREIDQLATEGKIDFRETRALNSQLAERLKKGEAVPRMSEEELRRFRIEVGLDEEEKKGFEWFAAKLEEVLKLLEKWLGAKLVGEGVREAVTGKKIEKQDRKFSNSPVGDKPLAANLKYEAGRGAEIKSERGAPVLAVEKGKVAVRDNTVTVTRENGVVITYENIVPEPGINGRELNAGAAIGKVPENGLFTMKLADSEGKEQRITDFLPEPVKANA